MSNSFIKYIGRLISVEPVTLTKKTCGYKRWTTEEKTFIREKYASKGRQFCADSLDRSIPSITRIASILNCQAKRVFIERRREEDELE